MISAKNARKLTDTIVHSEEWLDTIEVMIRNKANRGLSAVDVALSVASLDKETVESESNKVVDTLSKAGYIASYKVKKDYLIFKVSWETD
ncbi:hypothetical protein E4P35_13065 [Thiopseudomonas sp. 4R-3cl]|nr:hypothetical protein E4P35_13065 [Thiopseudomonas sp. 4R-3cl]